MRARPFPPLGGRRRPRLGQPPPLPCFFPSSRSRAPADFPAPRARRGGSRRPPSRRAHLTDASPPVPDPPTRFATRSESRISRLPAPTSIKSCRQKKRSVVRRIPVFFNRARAADQTLCVLQYPLRPADRPYDIQHVDAVRYKPKSGKLEIELPRAKGEAANERNVDPERRRTCAPTVARSCPRRRPRARYCVGAMRDGALHLTPVDAAFQCASLAHLDAADDRRKREDVLPARAARRSAREAGRRAAPRRRRRRSGRGRRRRGVCRRGRRRRERARKNEHDGVSRRCRRRRRRRRRDASGSPPSLVPLQVHAGAARRSARRRCVCTRTRT